MAERELPELGPYVGRLVDATRRFDDPAVGLDAIRLDLVSGLFERAAAARDFLLTGDRAGARMALNRGTWLELWRTAASRATEATMAAAAQRIEHAARVSRFPSRKLAALLPTAEDRAVLAARLDAAGIGLEERVERGFPNGEGWWDQIRQAAVALEDAWDRLELEVRHELTGASRTAARVAAWRPALWPWVVALGLGFVLLGWVGLMLGGYLPRPAWLDPLHAWFWSLPWL